MELVRKASKKILRDWQIPHCRQSQFLSEESWTNGLDLKQEWVGFKTRFRSLLFVGTKLIGETIHRH